MKKKSKKIAACAAFIVILAIILMIFSFLLSPVNLGKNYFDKVDTISRICEEPDDSIDVLFIGDSVAYSSISPMEMWKNNGITSYVCASNGQILSVSEGYIEEAFENQKPKVVVFEANAIYRKNKKTDNYAVKFESLFSVFAFHNHWKNLANLVVPKTLSGSLTDNLKGFVFRTTQKPLVKTNYMHRTEKCKPLPDGNEEIFERIVELCRQNNAEMLLVNSPNAAHWNYEKHNGIQKLADKFGITYLDMNLMKKQVPIDWEKDTRDKGDHLNYYGAKKVCSFLGNYLIENYGLSDHRGDEAFNKWNEDLEAYMIFANSADTRYDDLDGESKNKRTFEI